MKKENLSIPNKPLSFILFALSPFKLRIALTLVCLLIYEILGGVRLVALQKVIDSANVFANTNGSFNILLLWVFIFPSIILASIVFLRISGFLFNYASIYMRTYVSKRIFEYLANHSAEYFNSRLSGSLGNRASNILSTTQTMMSLFIWDLLGTFLTLATSFVVIYFTNFWIALLFLSGITVLIPINVFLTRKQADLSKEVASESSKMQGLVMDVISNIAVVHYYARTKYELGNLSKQLTKYERASIKSSEYGNWIMFANNFLVWVFVASVIGLSFMFWLKASITLGGFIMTVTIVSGFVRMLSTIGRIMNRFLGLYGTLSDALNEIIMPHEMEDNPNAKEIQECSGDIKFENVSFSYSDSKTPVLNDLSISIKPGEKVGVVGASGAGKTTFVKLLLRQYDVSKGAITIDGENIKNLTKESLMRQVAIVPQEPLLFNRSIRENIVYGKTDATDEGLIKMSKKAEAYDFIMETPDGYDSVVGEKGIKLSAGQRQRISIARAFLKEAPILVLDEATSALDSENEILIQKALDNLMENKTVIAIAHRLSTLRKMDKIIVFNKDGEIVEAGTHDTLLKNPDGIYKTLWDHQRPD